MPIPQSRVIELLTAARQCSESFDGLQLAIANEFARFVNSEITADVCANEMALIAQRAHVPVNAQVTIKVESERIERTREKAERYAASKGQVR